MITLAQLLPDFILSLPEQQVTGIKLDSRQVAGGDLFIAVPGYQSDGRDYIDAAIDAGAAAIFADYSHAEVSYRHGVPIIHIPQLKPQLSAIAGRFYQQPSARMQLVGVTGTNGKTSVTHLMAQLAKLCGHAAAVIGTTGSGMIGRLLPEQHTTPDAVTVQQRLNSLAAEGAQLTAMEVSSHALVQWRAEALQFKAVVATNISRDHLDYHGTLEAYAQAKQRLFSELSSTVQVLNSDDARLRAWASLCDNLWTYGLADGDAEHHSQALNIRYQDGNTCFDWQLDGESLGVSSPLLGEFNVYNLLAALTALAALGYSRQALSQACQQLLPVPGRMEGFQAPQQPLVVVDYAHTPDALQQILTAVRRHCRGKLWCVFGCGGDRDRGKRPQMGRVAAELADRVVVTDDNPRTEDPQQIVNDILTGIGNRQHVTVQLGRQQAVWQPTLTILWCWRVKVTKTIRS
ncbi:UDP-N-acetylmuramoyl-L-alanyl-D-glutamate--2,6-diaminopimelate ligase [Idiomarina xiamenensis]|uniref:UDP-N-acetylmuramoyl-L-alanyl-D-glutamate--2,6-diaminopimelate ligase n=1 Tax=Idiomarina xiamenensis 10-D-4 TaxID=740709 RepID=K2L6C3_9GAMM|nr:UDP-N-acetylmuramoyl-L-alanyl-D-glutamate--2,6-diaminopimelate ligase [Idiomarina xiamenensis]EKE85340.1 UDP-N-acetylmuramyl tripeptide synthase [Idiomarina xiamenensis 10-D-4]